MAQAPDVTPEQQLYEELKTKNFVAQMGYFANVNWTDLTDADKATMEKVLAKFDEQVRKFSAKPHQLTYPAFCKALQQLEDKDTRVHDVLLKSGDRSTMGAKFKELGFKLRGDVTMLECLLFLFDVTVPDLVTKPPTPMDAELRQARKELAELEAKTQADEDNVARLEKELEDATAMKALRLRQELNKAKEDLDKEKINVKRAFKAANKKVEEAVANLEKEKTSGTEATAWLRAACEKERIAFVQY